MKPVICIDLDGVLASWGQGTFHEIGPPIIGAVDFTRALSDIGDVVIYTCRCTEELYRPEKAHLLANRVREWLDRHGFCYADVWVGQGKPIAHVYIDDRAIGCRPEHDPLAFTKAEYSVAGLLRKLDAMLDEKTRNV